MADLEHVSRNVKHWNEQAAHYVDGGRRCWAGEPSWGIWGIPEREARLLPEVHDKDVLEAGCGTAYVSAWVSRLGGRPVGLDPTPAQLDSARMFQDEFGLRFPLIRAAAEALPFADSSFDVVVSEYGAAIWADPYLWIPEAGRVLRPGGELMFLGNADLLMLCVSELLDGAPAGDVLKRDYFGMHRFEWPDDDSVEFHITHGAMIRLLRDSGFEILDLVELRPGEAGETAYPWVTKEWAQRWPTEEVWKARRT